MLPLADGCWLLPLVSGSDRSARVCIFDISDGDVEERRCRAAIEGVLLYTLRTHVPGPFTCGGFDPAVAQVAEAPFRTLLLPEHSELRSRGSHDKA